jgi:hypothetical protein
VSDPPSDADVVRLDLIDEEADDPIALANRIDELRVLLEAGCRVELANCPQMLAHTLYKVGLLRERRIVIASMRNEEPYGS